MPEWYWLCAVAAATLHGFLILLGLMSWDEGTDPGRKQWDARAILGLTVTWPIVALAWPVVVTGLVGWGLWELVRSLWRDAFPKKEEPLEPIAPELWATYETPTCDCVTPEDCGDCGAVQ